ncbi:hypothetical protein [Saccharothrix obliqua]|uniref:hypothetical protein n=1 Tax=Saccharothrix obliqua TaxID=2861747 RepID=UPI001C6047FE|nr:hypothetical protein [Saccharothrix obliqua]MBW4716482.1 hypothetical protein [Saccharothrix obliqua]
MPARRPRSVLLVSLTVPLAALTGCAQEALPSPAPQAAGSSTAAPIAHLAAQPQSARAGEEVRLSGEGYPANSRVVFTFHGSRVGETTSDGAGKFAGAPVAVPDSFRDSPPGAQFLIGATSGPFYAETPFVITR